MSWTPWRRDQEPDGPEDREPDQCCPDCGELIGPDDINLREGVALCPGCGALSRLSDLLGHRGVRESLLDQPPRGCVVSPAGRGALVTASLRSLVGFFGGLFAALFWNGITSLFAGIALCGVYYNAVGPLPEWFYWPGVEDGVPIMNDEPMGPGATGFMCLFISPFVLIGCGLMITVLLSIAGRVEVLIDRHESYAATGVGPFLWKSRFDPRRVDGVESGFTKWRTNDRSHEQIELSADRTVKFGAMLPDERREWLLSVLTKLLIRPRADRIGSVQLDMQWLAGE